MASQHSKSTVKKPKLVRDSFTIPKTEFAAIESLKTRAIGLGTSVKKSELIRAGLMALQALDDAAYKAALAAVPTLKTGRPMADKPVAKAASKAATKPAAKAPAKTAAKAPAKAPLKAPAKPAAKAVAKPAVKRAAKPAAKPAAKSVAKPAAPRRAAAKDPVADTPAV